MVARDAFRWLSLVFALFGVMPAFAVAVTVDKVQQRYPWNGLVDVDYTIAYEDGEPALDPLLERLVVTVVDEANNPSETIVANNLAPAPLATTPGQHRLTWDANADGVDFKSDAVTVKIEIRRYAAKYLIVDLREGSSAKSYPVSYMSGEPTGGFNVPEFKTDKMVFRLVPPGSYMMGSPTAEKGRVASDETQHRVVISKPFYVGLFEVTQEQYRNVQGALPSSREGDLRPAAYLFGSDVRCASPTSAESAISASSFVGVFRARTSLDFDLPTEAQWEYACRAGKDTAFNDGVVQSTGSNYEAGYASSMNALGRYSGNNTEGDFPDGPTTVGSFEPNAWGLYDMHGNVAEYCRDGKYTYSVSSALAVDPVSTGSGATVLRGGGYSSAANNCRAASRTTHMGSSNRSNFAANGFRLVLTID